MLSQAALLHGPKGAASPSDQTHIVRPVFLRLQEDEVLRPTSTRQGSNLEEAEEGKREVEKHRRKQCGGGPLRWSRVQKAV